MVKQLVINQNDIYQVNEISYFKFQFNNKIYRDVNCLLEKNQKYILEIICKFCELEYNGLTKIQLINLISDSNCLIMN